MTSKALRASVARDIVRIAGAASDADRNVCRIERHRHNNDLRENKMREEDQYLQ